MTSLLVPPPDVRGQTKLDCEAFRVKLKSVPYLQVPQNCITKFQGNVKNFLLKLPKFKPVQTAKNLHGETEMCVYFDPSKIQNISDSFKEEINWAEYYAEQDLELTYENWPRDDVLRAILPENVEVPTSFSQIGHIIHINLRDEQLPFKKVIGQVLLDKTANARTVVNKLNVINNTYRNFEMEILVGDPDTIVTAKESGCSFTFDFAKVYWNPRLVNEHAALVNLLSKGDVLYDVFAGVGPFAVPAANKGVRVLANDLNPESYKWLCKNSQGKKARKLLTAFNKDGRDFLRDDVKRDILERRKNGSPGAEHLAMNLPALAVEFLDVFRDNWLSEDEADKLCSRPPMVHLYCFVKATKHEDWKALTRQLLEKKLGKTLVEIEVRHVRNVAPNKEMMRASFKLERGIFKNEKEEEPMGKNKGNKAGGAKNVFKVAGARSQRAKTKAKKVKTTLKKLDLGQGSKLNKEKTNQINKQLVELSKEVHQPKTKPKNKTAQPVGKTVQPISGQVKEQATSLIQNMQI
ncbi:tRNA (guanine(37)-N1)-methyltransferase [Nasonia vitripennis]|uniref:tRNA (guanine(37)-N1)-methyltransferase n=1 Tax=Nasonia vitripennis TaxID=7425 RepID=A0A7M7QZR5_NASVI|nr:tRNA (guanine(37)-N1)-methyltransferase [Nasonia vitripennis]